MTDSQHPDLVLSLRTRTRTFGIFNLAVALRGKSTGWGKGGPPRRTFVAHLRRGNRKEGRHFVEVTVWRDPAHDIVWERTLWARKSEVAA